MKKWLPFLVILGLIIGVSDYLAFPILNKLMFRGEGQAIIIVREIIMYFIVGLGGVYALNKFPEELFFASTSGRRKYARILAAGLILANTIFYIISITKFDNKVFVDLLQNNFFGALGIAVRSGITEELIFRFFLINSILFVGSGMTGNPRKLKITAIIISGIAFVFIHPINSAVVTLTSGLILGYIYFELGLVSAIFTHIFSNLIPFILIALKIIG
ncbi:MAG: protease family protein [Clostridia bacterium]|nr:protease family protein [Clostridia bacterium]MDN5323764.1 protease family protein [Clostridia bacterium]